MIINNLLNSIRVRENFGIPGSLCSTPMYTQQQAYQPTTTNDHQQSAGFTFVNPFSSSNFLNFSRQTHLFSPTTAAFLVHVALFTPYNTRLSCTRATATFPFAKSSKCACAHPSSIFGHNLLFVVTFKLKTASLLSRLSSLLRSQFTERNVNEDSSILIEWNFHSFSVNNFSSIFSLSFRPLVDSSGIENLLVPQLYSKKLCIFIGKFFTSFTNRFIVFCDYASLDHYTAKLSNDPSGANQQKNIHMFNLLYQLEFCSYIYFAVIGLSGSTLNSTYAPQTFELYFIFHRDFFVEVSPYLVPIACTSANNSDCWVSCSVPICYANCPSTAVVYLLIYHKRIHQTRDFILDESIGILYVKSKNICDFTLRTSSIYSTFSVAKHVIYFLFYIFDRNNLADIFTKSISIGVFKRLICFYLFIVVFLSKLVAYKLKGGNCLYFLSKLVAYKLKGGNCLYVSISSLFTRFLSLFLLAVPCYTHTSLFLLAP